MKQNSAAAPIASLRMWKHSIGNKSFRFCVFAWQANDVLGSETAEHITKGAGRYRLSSHRDINFALAFDSLFQCNFFHWSGARINIWFFYCELMGVPLCSCYQCSPLYVKCDSHHMRLAWVWCVTMGVKLLFNAGWDSSRCRTLELNEATDRAACLQDFFRYN